MNKQEVKTIAEEVREALKAVGLKHNMDIGIGNVTFTATQFSAKMTAQVKELDGKSLEQIEFEKYCSLFGFKPEDYRRVANRPSQGHLFRILGFKPSSPKFCLQVEDVSTGARFGLVDTARRLWGIEMPNYNLTQHTPPTREEVL